MAIPLIAVPGSIGVVIGLATKMSQWSEYVGCLIGITLFGGLLYVCLALGESLLSLLGHTGFGALNRVFGFFILAVCEASSPSGNRSSVNGRWNNRPLAKVHFLNEVLTVSASHSATYARSLISPLQTSAPNLFH